MAGMRVVVVACDSAGNVDLVDLTASIDAHRRPLAAIMVTYTRPPRGYETGIAELCAKVHDAAVRSMWTVRTSMRCSGFAEAGPVRRRRVTPEPAQDFCIPHGGGGPGVGPVAVRRTWPYLPAHPLRRGAVGPVSAAPHGSAGILPIPWAYIRLMGPDGLARATGVAVLAANYVAARLREHFPVLYAGNKGLVAHECILDLRPITKATG
jgi:glycine dehydrogenase